VQVALLLKWGIFASFLREAKEVIPTPGQLYNSEHASYINYISKNKLTYII